MRNIEDEQQLLTNIMRAVAETIGDKCEVVLHDWSKGYESSIVAIVNGHVTNRKVGDCGSNLGLEVMRGTIKNGDKYNYVTRTKDNKTLKSSTTYIKNDVGETIGALCVNLDVTDFINIRDFMDSFTAINQNGSEVFANDVGELLDFLLSESQKLVGKPVLEMNKEDKIEAIRYLDEKGAFLITKSGNRVCEFFRISKFTLYNYLDLIRSDHRKEAEDPI